jgi:pSer/pThr/pTyr-binding forkhead associated (FHA) protein
VEVGREPVTIGRGLANTVVLRDDPRASLRHAVLERTPEGRRLLRDEGSTNGTWVNGARVAERLLEDGDQVQVGDTVLRYEA